MIIYKIRNKSNNELFLKGTPTYCNWNKTGRIFQTIGNLRSFLSGVLFNRYRRIDISDWEIVEIELVEKSVKGVHEVVTPKTLVKILSQ